MKLSTEQEAWIRDAVDRAYGEIIGLTGNSWQAAELLYKLAREAYIAGLKAAGHGEVERGAST